MVQSMTEADKDILYLAGQLDRAAETINALQRELADTKQHLLALINENIKENTDEKDTDSNSNDSALPLRLPVSPI